MASLDGGINPNIPRSLPMGVKVATGISGTELGVATVVMTVFLVIFPHMGIAGIAALTTVEGVAFIAFAVSLYFLNKKQDEGLEDIQAQLQRDDSGLRAVETRVEGGEESSEESEVAVVVDNSIEEFSELVQLAQGVDPNSFQEAQQEQEEVLEEMQHFRDSCESPQNPNQEPLSFQQYLQSLQNPNQVVNPPPPEAENYDDLPELIDLPRSQPNIFPLNFDHGLQGWQDSIGQFSTQTESRVNTDPVDENEVPESEDEEENAPLNLSNAAVEEIRQEEEREEVRDEEDFGFYPVDNSNVRQEEIRENPLFTQFKERLVQADPTLASFITLLPQDKIIDFTCNDHGVFTLTFTKALKGTVSAPQEVAGMAFSFPVKVNGKIIPSTQNARGKVEFIYTTFGPSIGATAKGISVTLKEISVLSNAEINLKASKLAVPINQEVPVWVFNRMKINWAN